MWVDNILVGSLEDAVKSAIQAGLQFVVAAGNEDDNACDHVPARIAEAVTVGATYQNTYAFVDAFNHGSCIDLLAPGVDIKVARPGTTPYDTVDGTSFSAPYVAGTLAQILDQDPTASPARLQQIIVASATTGLISGLHSGTPNRFLSLCLRMQLSMVLQA